MDDLTLDVVLAQIRKNLHRSGQRVTLVGREQIERTTALLLQHGQQSTENPLCTSCADINQTERTATIVGIVVALHIIRNAQSTKKLLSDSIHGLFVVKLRGECVDDCFQYSIIFIHNLMIISCRSCY